MVRCEAFLGDAFSLLEEEQKQVDRKVLVVVYIWLLGLLESKSPAHPCSTHKASLCQLNPRICHPLLQYDGET